MTIHRFLARRYSSAGLPRLTSLLTIVTASGVIALELIVGAALIHSVNDTVPLLVTAVFIVLFATVAVIYTALGGFTAVIRTDRVQTLLVGGALLALLCIAGMNALQPASQSLSFSAAVPADTGLGTWLLIYGAFILGFGMFQLFLLPGDMMTWQRLTASGSSKIARHGVLGAALLTLVLWIVLVLIGVLSTGAPEGMLTFPIVGGELHETVATQAEPLTSLLASARAAAPISLQVALFVLVLMASAGLVSAILSTSDSFMLVVSQTLMFDWLSGRSVRSFHDLKSDPVRSARLATTARLILPAIAVLSLLIYGIVLIVGIPLVPVIFFMFSFQCAITPIAVHALRSDLDVSAYKGAAIVGLVLAGLTILVLFALSGMTKDIFVAYAYSYLAPVAAIVIPIGVFVLFELITRRPVQSMKLPILMVLGTARTTHDAATDSTSE